VSYQSATVKSTSSTASTYRWIAYFLAAVGILSLVVSAIVYWARLHHLGWSGESADWGTFGDFVGGLAGTTISLATLVAVVVNLHLQAKELENTSNALSQQAEASQLTAVSSARATILTFQPVFALERQNYDDDGIVVMLRNEGRLCYDLRVSVEDSAEMVIADPSGVRAWPHGHPQVFYFRSSQKEGIRYKVLFSYYDALGIAQQVTFNCAMNGRGAVTVYEFYPEPFKPNLKFGA
jgi:hypothetical protein